MITKAIVVQSLGNTATIRMPLYNKIKGSAGATPDKELYKAPICTLQNTHLELKAGDVVFVAFEEDQLNQPVIIGCLSGASNEDLTRGPSSTLDTADVLKEFNLKGSFNLYTQGDEPSISVTSENMFCLSGLKDNLKQTIEEINSDIDKLDGSISSLDSQVASVRLDLSSTSSEVENLQTSVFSLTQRISAAEGKLTELQTSIGSLEGRISNLVEIIDGLSTIYATISSLNSYKNTVGDTYLTKSSPVVTSAAYGKTPPSTATEGQLFFKID